MTSAQSPISEDAFTLIEVVMAIAILAIIVSIAYSSLSRILITKKELDDERDLSMVSTSVLNRMTRELQLATDKEKLMPPRGNLDQKYSEDVDMIGEQGSIGQGNSSDKITFLANDGGQYVRDGLTHSGIVQISYRVEEDPDHDSFSDDEKRFLLIRDETPFSRNYEKAYQKIMTFPVTKDLVSLQFLYFDGEEWSREWTQEQKSLPRLIKFIVKLMSPAGKIHTFGTIVPVGATEQS